MSVFLGYCACDFAGKSQILADAAEEGRGARRRMVDIDDCPFPDAMGAGCAGRTAPGLQCRLRLQWIQGFAEEERRMYEAARTGGQP